MKRSIFIISTKIFAVFFILTGIHSCGAMPSDFPSDKSKAMQSTQTRLGLANWLGSDWICRDESRNYLLWVTPLHGDSAQLLLSDEQKSQLIVQQSVQGTNFIIEQDFFFFENQPDRMDNIDVADNAVDGFFSGFQSQKLGDEFIFLEVGERIFLFHNCQMASQLIFPAPEPPPEI